jgi:hypothetical protein
MGRQCSALSAPRRLRARRKGSCLKPFERVVARAGIDRQRPARPGAHQRQRRHLHAIQRAVGRCSCPRALCLGRALSLHNRHTSRLRRRQKSVDRHFEARLGPAAGKPAPWHIDNLHAKARYALWIDGRRVARIGGGQAQVLDSSPPGLTMTAGTEGSADVQSVLNGPTTFILSQED